MTLRRFVATAADGLISVGLWLENTINGRLVPTHACPRCDERLVLTGEQLATLFARAASGEPPHRLLRDVREAPRLEVVGE